MKRDAYFDNAKYILIMLVVFGHSIESFSKISHYVDVYRLLYMFHMPCFALISGYIFRRSKKSDTLRLLKLYIIFQTIWLLYQFFTDTDADRINIQYTTPVWVLWFFLSLTIWRLILPQFARLGRGRSMAIIIAVAIFAGYDNTIGYYLTLSRTIVFLPFFAAGYFADEALLAKVKKFPKLIAAAAIILVYIVASALDFRPHILYGSASYSQLWEGIWYAGIYRLAIMAAALVLSVCFLALVPKRKMFFTSLGAQTLPAFALHGLLIRLYLFIGAPSAWLPLFALGAANLLMLAGIMLTRKRALYA
jgi:fucose 4-O-acetylase-like acetyltransferase